MTRLWLRSSSRTISPSARPRPSSRTTRTDTRSPSRSSPRGLGELLDGDRVSVRVVRDDGRGRAEGEIVRLLERSHKRVMGAYRSAGRKSGGTVQAYDR